MTEAAPLFATREQEEQAGRLGMWIFLATEVLLFTGLFALYGAGRILHPQAFAHGVGHNLEWDGTTNTFILLISSYWVARSLSHTRAGRVRRARAQLVGAAVIGAIFLGLKGYEYGRHIADGIVPGAGTSFFTAHPEPGLPYFFTMYYLMTGLHAIHVTVGIGVLLALAARVSRRGAHAAQAVELGGLYWHLVDVIWIFLWPLFYLTHHA